MKTDLVSFQAGRAGTRLPPWAVTDAQRESWRMGFDIFQRETHRSDHLKELVTGKVQVTPIVKRNHLRRRGLGAA